MPIPLHVSSSILLLLFSSSLQLVIADSSLTFVYYFCIEERGTYTSNSIFADNLNQVLSNLTSEAQLSGFNKTSIGFSTDQVNGLYMCRGDVASDTCQFCIITASKKIQALCPNQKEVVIWYNRCMLRYSDRSFFSTAETDPSAYWNSNQNVSNMVQFDQLVKSSLESLANKTAFDPLTKMYVSNETNSGSFELYSLLQCTQDLSPSGCYLCLKTAISGIQINGGTGRTWVLEVLPSCILQYSVTIFYYTAPPPPPPQPISVVLSPPPLQSPSPVHSPVRALPSPSSTAPATNSTNHGNQGSSSKKIIFFSVPLAAAALFLAVGLLFYCLRRKRKDGLKPNDVSRNAPTKKNASKDEGNDSLEFDLSTIKAATKNFDTTNTLGQGGFGIVYQGILPNGQEIAVKRLSKNSGQGDKEFKNEVQLVANLQHKNLVRLLGFCMREDEKLLIYEFVPNASLDRFLFDPIKRSNLNWEARYKIIAGIARGLVYLHEDSRLKIIHRDLKSSNILLDSDLCPKIADFGMARLVGMDETHLETSRIAGTYGYMAPEYVLNGQFSVKSDVYSYGVLILEIVSGQRNGSNSHQLGYSQDLLRHAWEHWAAGTPMEFVDFTVRERCSKNEALRSIHIGLSCIQDEPALRPSMASVVLTLQTDSLTLPVPSPPAFLANGMGIHTREYFQRRILSTTTTSI